MRLLIFIIGIFLIQSCSTNQEERLAKLDKVYGKCDNPHRQYNDITYEICKSKERAAGPDGVVGDPINITDLISGLGKNNSKATIVSSDTNNFLWDAALNTLNQYAFKITDYDGGYIETDWIMQSQLPDQRCLIKSHISSAELVSNGVSVRIVCEELINQVWYQSDKNFQEEEKQLVLKILQEASILSNSTSF